MATQDERLDDMHVSSRTTAQGRNVGGGKRRRKLRSKRARDRLALEHAHLAGVYAWKYGRGSVPVEDLAQEAWLGILVAAERFDERLGIRFDTFARYHARRFIIAAKKRGMAMASAGDPTPARRASIRRPSAGGTGGGWPG